MAPEPEILKRKRSRPSDWWAASPAATTSTPPQPAKAPNPPKIPAKTKKQPEAAPVSKVARSPLKPKNQAQIIPAPERDGLKRKRSRPSDWWAASPSSSQLQENASPLGRGSSGSRKRTAGNATLGGDKGRVDKSVRGGKSDDGSKGAKKNDENVVKRKGRHVASQVEDQPKGQDAVRKRGKPAGSREQEAEEPDQASKQSNRGRSSKTAAVVEHPELVSKSVRPGRSSNTEAEVQAAVESLAKDSEGKDKRGRRVGGSAKQQSDAVELAEVSKGRKRHEPSTPSDAEEETRGRRRTRRSDARIEEPAPPSSNNEEQKKKRSRLSGEVVHVETASSRFGKARGRPTKPATAEPAPRSSKPEKHAKQSISSSSKEARPSTTKASGKKAARSSNVEPLQRKRKVIEKPRPDAPDTKRRRVDEADQEEETEAQRNEKQPKYQHLAEVMRKVPRHTIDTKWGPLPANCLELISQLLIDVQRPVVARIKEDHKRSQATSALQSSSHSLLKKISKGIPFPQGTRPQREDDFNFEKILDHNMALEAQLTPALHANELLEDELHKESVWLESEKANLVELERNAKAAAISRKQAERKLHSLLQSEDAVVDGEDLGYSERSVIPVSGILEDESLQDIIKGLEGHMDSMQGNLKQIEGINEAMSRSKAAVQATLFDHLDASKYEDVVLGL